MAIDDAFINPELELQMHQSNLETGPSYDAVQLQQSINKADALLDDVKTDTEAVTALEAMGEFIKNRTMTKTSAILFNIAAEGYGNLSSMDNAKIAFGLESMTEEDEKLPPQEINAAMENIAENAMFAMKKLVNSLNDSLIALGDVVHGFDKNLLSLKKRIADYEELIRDIDSKDELVYNYVKPEKQYVHLMYTDDGFERGIRPVIQDVRWLYKEHADMVNDSVGKYKNWFNQNKEDYLNSNLFSSLQFSPDDFVISGSTVFNKSIGNKIPSKASVFYKSKELPGGKSFYTNVRDTSVTGIDAVNALMDVNYYLDYHEPDSFRVTEKRLYTVAGMGLLVWASVMMANPLPMAFAGLLTRAVSDETKTSDIKKVRVTKDVIFAVLTKDELKETLVEMKRTLAQLEKWNAQVYKNLWKDQSLREATQKLTDHINKEGIDNKNIRYLRNYAVALVSLMSKSYTKLHSYGFDVLNASLSYAEKSAKQYR